MVGNLDNNIRMRYKKRTALILAVLFIINHLAYLLNLFVYLGISGNTYQLL